MLKQEYSIRFANIKKWDKITSEFLILIASQTIQIIIGEIQSRSSPNLMIIKITLPNLLHDNDFS